MKPLVSIIIVTYNSAKFIIRCLNSINKVTYKNKEIIIVDNSSTDNTLKLITGYRINLIKSDKNLGFGKASNLGAKMASGKYLFFLNPDTELTDNEVLDKLIYEMEKDKLLGAISPFGYKYEDGAKRYHSILYVNRYAMLPMIPIEMYKGRGYSRRFFGEDELNHNRNLLYVDCVQGSHLFVRRDLFNKLNGFDERFFFYCEDNDLCLRIWKYGYKIAIVLDAEIYHYGGGSSSSRIKVYEGVKSRTILIYLWNNNGLIMSYMFLLGAILKRIIQFRFSEIPLAVKGGYDGIKSLRIKKV